MRVPWIVSVFLLLFAGMALATELRVLALFPGKAMVQVDGKRLLLKAGEVGRNGYKLIETDTYKQQAVIEYAGRQQVYELGRHAGGGYAKREKREYRILRNNHGSYVTRGAINGRAVEFLVDTGASSVAMSEVHARRLGIPYRLNGKKIRVGTASGSATGYALNLDSVKIGELQASNVEGVVIKGDSPRRVLLGMSFLNQFELQNQGNLLVIRNKF